MRYTFSVTSRLLLQRQAPPDIICQPACFDHAQQKRRKRRAWNVCPVVLFVIRPVSKSTSTSSPGEMPATASGHSRIGSPILNEFL